MIEGKSYHMALNIDAPWEKWGRYVTHEGRPVTSWEFEKIRAECKAKGYRVFPPCDHVKADGHCAGHEDGTVTRGGGG